MPNFNLVIPTYRLRDLGEVVEAYRKHFNRFKHDLPIIVFDDSSREIQESDFPLFAAKRFNDTFYVGPEEKEKFIDQLVEKVGPQQEKVLRNLLKPSYGGNRNFTILYTLGDIFMSVDDDMRPHGLYHHQSLNLGKKEVLRGTYVDKKDPFKEIISKEEDIVAAYLEVLGKKVKEIEGDYLLGFTLTDSMTDLFNNATKGGKLEPNVVTLNDGSLGLSLDAKIITAQTFRSGSADIDAVDYVNDFLVNPENAFVNDMSLRYVLQGFRPCITKTNWRFDCGVSAYDNSNGLPPFLPTIPSINLRFEDYGFRIWLQHPQVAAAHVRAVQTHYRNPYQRESLAKDLLNEEMTCYIKPLLRQGVEDIKETSIIFNVEVNVTVEEAKRILTRGKNYFKAVIGRASEEVKVHEVVGDFGPDQIKKDRDARYFTGFAGDLYEAFAGFDITLFREQMQKNLVEEVENIQETMAIWPSLLEVAKDIKKKKGLPLKKVSP